MKRTKQAIVISIMLSASMGLMHAPANEVIREEWIPKTESPAEQEARMKWWKDARFGMFVHWGLYSSAEGEWNGKPVAGSAEWIQRNAQVPAEVYEATMLPRFKPAPDFATQWARLARQAGARYVVFTGKHHEGFCLHNSAQTTFDAHDVTGRDLHREIVEAIRREGLKVGVYHSLWDWHHPDAPAGSDAINVAGTSMEGRELPRYADYLREQVREQTDGRYGPVDVLWMDYSKGRFQGDAWGAKEIVEMVRRNQPQVLINNRLWEKSVIRSAGKDQYWFGDFATPEQYIPATGIKGLDWETCDTLNITWGWSKHATNYKTGNQLIQRLVDAVSKGGNYLLNVGPLPDGTIDPKSVQLFGEIGTWMQTNAEAIYGTRASPFTRLPWGRATARILEDGTHRLYLHVFAWPATGELPIPGLQSLPVRSLVVGGDVTGRIRAQSARGMITLTGLPESPLHPGATVIALDFNQRPQVGAYRVYASTDGSFTLEPADAIIKGGATYQDHGLHRRSRLEAWEPGGAAAYPLYVEEDRTCSVEIDTAAGKLADGTAFVLALGETQLPLELKPTGGQHKWRTLQSGSITLPAGESSLELRCTAGTGTGHAAFSTIRLTPLPARKTP